jgi:trehalose/maltose transport system permease protein
MNSRVKTAWLFLAPMVLLMLVVAVWPLARSIWFSFTDININDISAAEFVGWENYFGDYGLFFNPNEEGGFWAGDWGISIRNTFSFAVVSVILETLTGLGVALLLNQEFKGRGFVRTAVLVPWAIPTIVSAKMWGWMLNDQFGVINNYLMALGVISQKIAWTAEPAYALWTVVLVDVWKTTPFMALLILAALQTVPKDCYEAARVDGVHPLRVFWKITTANGSTTISMSGFVRREMVEYGNMGYGSAASTSLFLIILLTAIIFLKLARVKMSEDAK